MKKDDVNNITGCILSDFRKSTGLTQKEFAKAFNVSEGTIAHYEQGITIPNSEMLLQYANFFHVNVDYLLGRCMMSMDYSRLNETLYSDMSLSDMVNVASSLSKDKKHYLYQTLKLLESKKTK